MDRWRDQVAVVTGASSGIGAAISQKLVEQGLKVVGIARRKERVEDLAKNLNDKKGKLIAVKADLTKQDEILEAFSWIAANVGPISILVNNAGVGVDTTIVDGDIEKWKKVLDTNVLGLAIATREAIKSMQKSNIDGHIVNINSTLGHKVGPLPYQNVYPASKFAVTAFTETLRLDLVAMKSKIKVSSVSPGFVDTEIFSASGLSKNQEVSKMLDVAPKINSEDVANSIIHVLATPPNVQITELIIKPVGEFI